MDAVCFIAHTVNGMLDAGYTIASLHNQNTSTFLKVGRVMQGIKFAGVSGFVGFPSGDKNSAGGGDRAGSTASLEQIVEQSRRLATVATNTTSSRRLATVATQVAWGISANGKMDLLPGKEPKFSLGYTYVR